MTSKLDFIRERLARGESVVNKEGGNSMLPLIKSRQPVTLELVDAEQLEPGDIVYVKVKGRVYTHLVLAVREGQVQIGNNHGGVNGWTALSNVYAIVTEIDGNPIERAKKKVRR